MSNTGYGFVEFSDSKSAELAVKELTRTGVQAQMAKISPPYSTNQQNPHPNNYNNKSMSNNHNNATSIMNNNNNVINVNHNNGGQHNNNQSKMVSNRLY